MRKKRRPPYTPIGDLGPDTPAQWAGKVILPLGDIDPATGKRINPNGQVYTFRRHILETYHAQGRLTYRQCAAGMTLLRAWETTQRSPPAIQEVKVDASPKPDQFIAISTDRQSGFHQVSRMVPAQHARFVNHVALGNLKVSLMRGYRRGCDYMDRLRLGLDGLADGLGL